MFPDSVFLNRNEKGYSLIGVVIALAITIMVVAGVMSVIFQIYSVSADRTNHIIAIREVQNAGHWLANDGQKAVTVQPTPDPDGFPLMLSWNDQTDNEHQVVYTLYPDNIMLRAHYTNRTVNPLPDSTTMIASYIDPSGTSCGVSPDDELVANITAAVNIDNVTYTEKRTYRIFPRGSLR